MAYFGNMSFVTIDPDLKQPISAAQCKDGRIIVVYNVNDFSIGQGYAESYHGLKTARALLDKSTILSFTEHKCQATVFNIKDDLYLGVTKVRYDPGTTHQTVIYKSPSGNGGDWVIHGYVQDFTVDPESFAYPHFIEEIFPPSIPLVLDSGRWVIYYRYALSYHYTGSMYLEEQHGGIATSDDGGITWTLRATMGEYMQGSYTHGSTRNIGKFGDDLYIYVSSDVADYNHVLKGTNNAEDWSAAYSVPGHVPYGTFFNGLDGWLYWITTYLDSNVLVRKPKIQLYLRTG